MKTCLFEKLTPMLALAYTLLASPASSIDPTQRGLEIARAADASNHGFRGERGVMLIEIVNSHGEITKRRMNMKVLEGSTDGDRSHVVFDWPPDVKGTKLLTWSHKRGEDDQWLYLPAVKRVKRISGSNKAGSFMGSEFAYEDLSSQEIEKFTYRYLDEPVLDGRTTWRIERFPVDPASGYRGQTLWIDKEFMAPVRIEYRDRKDELLKVASFEGYHKLGNFWRFRAVRIENVQTRKKSNAIWETHDVGVALPEQDFESSRLED